MRELLVVDVSDPRSLVEPLRRALFEDGPAVLPRPGGARLIATAPMEVADDIALVIETSGTTGAPKRVALSAEAVLSNAKAALAELGEPGVWLLLLPAHYIAGVQVIARALVSGTTPVVLHPEPFSTVAMASQGEELRNLAGDSPVYTAMVPAQLQRILDDAPAMARLDDLMKTFGRILVGGQAIPQTLLDRSADAGYRVTRTYGSSETSGGCVWDGRPIGDTTVAEFDGRIAISGPTLAHSYLEDPERTARSFVERDGTLWYLSDDAGSIDDQGIVSIQGRLDDVIVTGGVKVALGRIERLVHGDFHAPDAVVVAAEHDTWGQVPVVVTTKELDITALRLGIGGALGPEARPDRVLRVSEIPHLPSGKPDRLALAALVKEKH
ncbi:MAG: AMP-binding protein [Microbacteriaceae bacterium]|jgi:o-succinylbenzoate---CoA ligase|nr:AMP-binding protein [Microbacteriaceae bacterium]